MSSEYSLLKSEIEKTGQTILKIAQRTNNTAIAEFLSQVLDNLSEEESCHAIPAISKKGALTSACRKLEKSASDLWTYFLILLNSLTMPLDLVPTMAEFERYLDLVEQRKRELFHLLEGRMNNIVSMVREDLVAFEKEHVVALVKKFAEEKIKSEKTKSEKVYSVAEARLRKTLVEIYSRFIRHEDLKVESQFKQLVNDANEKMNTLIADIKLKASELFEFRVISLVFHSLLSFESSAYYHMNPNLATDITFNGETMAESLSKIIVGLSFEKRIEEMARMEFNDSGRRINDCFVARLDQAVLKLKNDINRAFEASAETIKLSINEAKQLRTKNETEMFTAWVVLNRMLAQLENVREKFGWEFKTRIENLEENLM